MPYCTQANITAIYPASLLAELTNGTGGIVNTTAIAAAIEKADTHIDYYCEGLYGPMPFSPVPTMVKWWSIDLALMELAKLVPMGASPGLIANGELALNQLRKIADGDRGIPGVTPTRRMSQLSPDRVPVFSIGRVNDSGDSVGTPTIGTLDNW